MRIADLAGIEASPALLATRDALDANAPQDYRELAALLAHRWRESPPRRVGLSGGQGAGKSTLAALIESACSQVKLRCCVLSLDDFYLRREDRLTLAERVHPTLATRGPPGTHDIPALRTAMESLFEPGEVKTPIFDKGIDDRSGSRVLRGPFDLVIVEGWCIGAAPSADSDLESPINALELQLDADGVGRRYVNEQLRRDYAPWTEELDYLAFLKVPSLDAVRAWRLDQERERSADQRMSAAEVTQFVEHYERISLAMLRDVPLHAQAVIELDSAHRVSGLSFC
ncbi:MAG: kinase [Myxococcota bacterium]|nr:kinase [Myxococcota bacterium]